MKADILACWSNGIVSKLISTVTKNKVSHIAIKINDKLIMESRFIGTKLSLLENCKCNYIVLRCPYLNEKQRNAIIKFVMESVDKKYDFRLFTGIGINRIFGVKTNWDNPKKYICVELIIEAFRSVGIELLESIPDQEIVPSDFLNSDKLIVVSEHHYE